MRQRLLLTLAAAAAAAPARLNKPFRLARRKQSSADPAELLSAAALGVRGGAYEDDDEEAYEDDAEAEEIAEDEDENLDEEVLSGTGIAWVTRRLENAATALGCASGLARAEARARLEQRVEDYNALQKAQGTFHRAVLVLPLTAEFDPPRGQPGHGKVQFSDRVSASRSVGAELTRRALEVPWHFELEPLAPRDDAALAQGLAKVFCSPLDFRAPENFLFCPLWMLRQLRVLPYDVCFLTWVKLNDGVTIELQPHQDAFLRLSNPRAVLEEELKWYSSATRLSTISLSHDGTQYDFDVTGTVGKDGTQFDAYNPEKCAGVAIQDADVSLDLTAHGLDKPPKRRAAAAAAGDEED